MVLRRTHFKKHHIFFTLVLMRTAPRFSHKYPGKLVVLLRTAVRFSQKYFFKKHPSVLLWLVIPNSAMGLIIVVFTSSLAPLDHRLDEPCCIDTRFPSPLCRPSALDCLFRAVDTNEAPFLSRGISREANLNPATRSDADGTATTTDGSKLGGLSVLAVVLFSTYYIFG